MSVNCHFIGGPKDGETVAYPEAAPEINFPWMTRVDLAKLSLGESPSDHGTYVYRCRSEIGVAAYYDFDPSSAPRSEETTP